MMLRRMIFAAAAILLALVQLAAAAPAQPLPGRPANEQGLGPIAPCAYAGADAGRTTTLCSPGTPLPVEIVVRGAPADRGGIVGTVAVTLAPANPARRGWALQVQAATSVSCYVSGGGAATTDYHSLQVGGGGYYQTPDGHVGTGALSVICTAAATPVYLREW